MPNEWEPPADRNRLHPSFGSAGRSTASPGRVPRSVLTEAVVLAHNVDDAELLLVTDHGRLRVGRSRSCDLSPCALHRVLVLDRTPTGPRSLAGIRTIEVSGSLRHAGGGLYERRADDGRSERWFTTEMCAGDVVAIAERCDVDGVDDVVCRVGSDLQLGVTTVRLTPTVDDRPVDGIARWVLGRCLVDELVQQVRSAGVTPGT